MRSPSIAQDVLVRIDQAEARFEMEEPRVRAFLPEEGRFERLREQARSLLARAEWSERRPALFGVLVGVKDIFHVDGFETQAGSRLPAEALRGMEAESVSRLKAAGALVLGKTVTTEFAYFSPGPTRNPHNLDHTPGGSSSGSAAAVAAGLCTLTLGTQTIGSILRPAAFCGVVGMKPTYERISREGVIPLSPSLDHVGFFTRNVAEAMQAARILYRDWREPAAPAGRPVLGIPLGPYLESATEGALVHFRSVCQSLAEDGYELWEVEVMPDFAEIRARHDLILAAEAAIVHAAWFRQYEDLYAPRTAELIRRGQAVSESELAAALDGCGRLRAGLQALMEAQQIDLWISPSTPGPAPRGLESTGDPVMNLPWTQAGLPALNLPAGKAEGGLPLGLQVTGRWSQDETLLAWAEALERVLSQR